MGRRRVPGIIGAAISRRSAAALNNSVSRSLFGDVPMDACEKEAALVEAAKAAIDAAIEAANGLDKMRWLDEAVRLHRLAVDAATRQEPAEGEA